MLNQCRHASAVVACVLLIGILALPAAAQPRCELGGTTPFNPAEQGFFGYDVDLSGDTAVVGAPGAEQTGAAYVYVYDGITWSFHTMLTPFDGQANDEFGKSVAIDGDTIVVGAPENYGSGSAYVYRRDAGIWSHHAKILPHDGTGGDQFGYSVDIQGGTIVIGAPERDEGGESEAGAAYIFEYDGQGWDQYAKLTYQGGLSNDHFGEDVAISGDVIVIGAEATTDVGPNAGEIYVYRHYEGAWHDEAILRAADSQANSMFGASVATDGEVIVVGCYQYGTSSIGAAYVFRYEDYEWAQEARLRSQDLSLYQYFASAVSVSGNIILIGASNDPELAGSTGAAYVFEFDGSSWIESEKIFGLTLESHGAFGNAVVVDQGSALIGALTSSSPLDRCGAIDFFNFSDCNGNGICDAIDLLEEGGHDCNGNWRLDECDVLDGTSNDCDGNEIPDECDVLFLDLETPRVGPLGFDQEWTYVTDRLPPAGSDVEFTIAAVGDLGALTEWLDLELNGVNIGRVFANSGVDCGAAVSEATLTLAAEEFNNLLDLGSDTTFELSASPNVDSDWCDTSYATLTINYQAIAPNDCNGNGVPDVCDVLSGASPDTDYNLIPDECQPPCFGDLNGNGMIGLDDLQILLAHYGTFDNDYQDGDLDDDRDIDLSDLNLILTRYGAICE